LGGRFFIWVSHEFEKESAPLAAIAAWVIAGLTLGLTFFTGTLWKSTSNLVRDSNDSSQKELRAWLGPLSGSIEVDDAGYISITIHVHNVGKTPAHDVRQYIAVWDEAASPHPLTEAVLPSAREQKYVLPPTGRYSIWYPLEGLDQPLRGIRGRKPSIVIYGKVTYRDVFQQPGTPDRKLVFAYRSGQRYTEPGIGTRLIWYPEPLAEGFEST
jgi:hypothetical protein